MVNVENCLLRTFTFFPKHVTFTPWYGQCLKELLHCFVFLIFFLESVLINRSFEEKPISENPIEKTLSQTIFIGI